MSPAADDLEQVVRNLAMVDTHEHLLTSAELVRYRPDVLVDLFSGYLAADLVSAGAERQAVARLLDVSDADIAARFRGISAAWEQCRHTGFGRAASRIAESVYGLDDIDEDGLVRVAPLTARLREPGHRSDVLRHRARLDHVQLDDLHWRCELDPFDPDFFLSDISWLVFAGGDRRTRLDVGGTGRDYDELAAASGIEIVDLGTLLETMEWVVATHGPRAIAIKSQHAYVRGLEHRPRSDVDAARSLQRVLRGRADSEDMDAVGDWALSAGARLAGTHSLPFKLHTGYLAGNDVLVPGKVRPGSVAQLVRAHPHTRFVVMHVGHPSHGEALALAKHYANVYVDWCWAWSLDPLGAQEAFRRALHSVPLNKLFAFGGDAAYAHAACAYAEQAREGLLRALTAEVDEGLLTTDAAINVAVRVMRANQLDVFDVERVQGPAAVQAPLTPAVRAAPAAERARRSGSRRAGRLRP
jgi:predicted TIM-barrel fold metal-dependent hydrolase